jgi:arginine deiminase
LPNTQYTRDTTCWIYGGVTLNPLYWPARHEETMLTTAIYKFHPDFANARLPVWYGDPDHRSRHGHPRRRRRHADRQRQCADRHERAHLAPGHQPARRRAVQAKGAAERVIVAAMPKLRAAMHLDTVFTFCDRDCVLLYPTSSTMIGTFSTAPGDQARRRRTAPRKRASFTDVVAEALNFKKLRVVETGGNATCASATQWDDGNNVVCPRAGVVFGL